MNDTLIDQTWVRTYGDNVTLDYLLETARWVARLPDDLRLLAYRFPPRCLVRRKARPWHDWDGRVPVQGSLGIVRMYAADCLHVAIQQQPGGECHWVPVDELEYAAPWAGLTAGYLAGVHAAYKASVLGTIQRAGEKFFGKTKTRRST
jgi:hypothetical protein